MTFNLHDGRFYFRPFKSCCIERIGGIKITDTQSTHLSIGNGFFHSTPSAAPISHRLMDIKQVYIIQTKTVKHHVNGFGGFLLSIFAGPQFACDPYLFTWHAAFFYTFANSSLHPVSMGSVNMAIAILQGIRNRIGCHGITRHVECSNTETWHLQSIVQGHIGYAVFICIFCQSCYVGS